MCNIKAQIEISHAYIHQWSPLHVHLISRISNKTKNSQTFTWNWCILSVFCQNSDAVYRISLSIFHNFSNSVLYKHFISTNHFSSCAIYPVYKRKRPQWAPGEIYMYMKPQQIKLRAKFQKNIPAIYQIHKNWITSRLESANLSDVARYASRVPDA